MNIEDCFFDNHEYSRMDYLKLSKIEEIDCDKLSTGWFVYSFNE